MNESFKRFKLNENEAHSCICGMILFANHYSPSVTTHITHWRSVRTGGDGFGQRLRTALLLEGGPGLLSPGTLFWLLGISSIFTSIVTLGSHSTGLTACAWSSANLEWKKKELEKLLSRNKIGLL